MANEVEIKVTADAKGVKVGMKEAAAEAKAGGQKAGEEFGDGWVRGADGKLRDAKGRFVSAGEQAAAGLAEGMEKGLKTQLDGVFSRAFDGAGAKVGDFTKSFAKFETFSPMLGGVAGAVGAVGAAAGAALPLLVSLGAAGGVVAAGMDGIKAAAKQAEGGLNEFKKTVSATFERMLGPEFAKIGKTLTQIDGAASEAAGGISQMAAAVLSTVSSADNLSKLHDILWGVGDLFAEMAPGMKTFTQGLIDAGSAGSTSMGGLGAAIGSVFGEIGRVTSELAADGTLNKAIDGFSATLTGLGKVAGSVLDILVRMGAAVGDGLGVFLTDLSVGLDKASPGMQELAKAGGELLKALGPLMPVLGELAGEVFHQLAEAVKEATPHIKEFAQWAVENKDTLKEWVPIIMQAIVAWKAFSLAMKAFTAGKAIATGLGTIAAAVKKIGTDADDSTKKVGGLADKLKGLGGGKGGGGLMALGKGALPVAAGAAVLGFGKDAVEDRGNAALQKPAEQRTAGENVAVKGAQGDWGGWFSDGWKLTAEKSKAEIAGWFTTLKEMIKTKASEAWTGFTESLAAVPGLITTKLSEVWTSITTTVTGWGTSLLETGKGIWNSLVQGATEGLAPVREFFAQSWADIGLDIAAGIGTVGKYIYTGAQAIWTQFTTALSEGWTVVKEFFTTTLPAELSAAWEAVKTWFTTTLPQTATEAWEAFKTASAAKWAEFTAWVATLPETVYTALAALVERLTTKATESWEAFKAAALAKWNEIIAWVTSLPETVYTAMAALVARLTASATEAWEAFKAAAIAKWNEIITEVSTWPQKIVDAFKDLPSLLSTVGSNALQGLIDGMKAKAQAAIDYAKELANAVVSAFNSTQGFNTGSPSKKMRDHVGKWVTLGLVSGMRRQSKHAIRESQRIAQAVVAAGAVAGFQPGDPRTVRSSGSSNRHGGRSHFRGWGNSHRGRGRGGRGRHDWSRGWGRQQWSGGNRFPRDASVVAGFQMDDIRAQAAAQRGGRGGHVTFGGNTDSAFATAFMKLHRTGQIQIR